MTQKRPAPRLFCALSPLVSATAPFLTTALLLTTTLLCSCNIDAGTGKGAASIVGKGIVNDPTNKSLRFEMIEFGLHEFCKQLLMSGAPLRLADDQPVIGRYFAESCEAKSLDGGESHKIIAQFGGRGYAWTLGTGRLGFQARGLLELAPDFRIFEGSLYVYFRPVQVDTSDFSLVMTESKLAQAAAGVAGLDEAELGRAIIDAQLGRGFTVVRYDAGGLSDFALGLVEEGETPFLPYQVESSPRRTAANARTEIFVGQQDYIGRLRVGKGEGIILTARVEGVPAVDVAIVPADGGRPVMNYVQKPGAQKLHGQPVLSAVASSVAPFRTEVPVSPGDYYLVFDHSTAVGATSPGQDALPARVDYLLQIGQLTAP